MRDRHGEGPEPQLRWSYPGQHPRMASIDEPEDTKPDDQQTGAYLDLLLPFDDDEQQREGKNAHEQVLRQLEPTAWVCIGHDLSAWYAVGIELVVPRRIERVGPVYPLAVTANLDHLRTASKGLAVRVGRTTSDAADVDRACKLW